MSTEALEALAGTAAGVDADLSTPLDAGDGAAGAPPKSPEDAAREWAVIAYSVGGALAILAPELKDVYTEDRCMAWGASVVPVAEKYGWNGPGNVPEVGLALSTLALAVPSALAIRARMAEAKAEREKAERAQRSARAVPPPPPMPVPDGAG